MPAPTLFRESLFLLPAVMVVGGAALAGAVWAIDRSTPPGDDFLLTLGMSTNAAIWLLSVVAGAMITTAGVVFSLTVVSLQPASSQSPIRPWPAGVGGNHVPSPYRRTTGKGHPSSAMS